MERRRAWVLAALAVTTAAGAVLATIGLSVVRDSTAGRYVDPPIRPDEPGYQAYVASTPTLAVVHRGPAGGLAGAALLALQPGDDGGAVVVVPPSTQVPSSGGSTVAAAYREAGADAVVDALSDVLDIAVGEVVEVDQARWSTLVEPVTPVTITVETAGAPTPGEVELAAEDVGAFLVSQSGDDAGLDRVARQAAFWTAWLAQVGAGGPDAVPGEIDVGIGRFVRGVAQDPSTTILPVTPVEGRDDVVQPDDDRLAELVGEAVPYPLSPAPGRRVRVRLLNGTTDRDLTPAAARQLVEAGAEITIAGNAASFDVDETTLSYRSPDLRDEARQLADAVGVGAVEEADRSPSLPGAAAEAEEEIDVTIVLGADAQDLIGRLENPG